MSRKNKWKRKAAAGAACAAVSAGILLGSAFDTPSDLLDGGDAVTLTLQAEDSGAAVQERKTHRGFSLRQRVSALPLWVRAWVCVPLWCINWAIIGLAETLYSAALTPVGGMLLGWVLAAAMVIGVFCLTAKAMFPGVSLKKLLRPRHFVWLLAGMFALGVADFVLPYFWSDYPALSRLLRMVGSAVLVGIGALSLWRLGRRREKAAQTTARTPVEQQAMAMADSVCPRPVYRPEG